jgi:hypothetical protein
MVYQSIQWLGYGLNDRVSIAGKSRDFYFLRHRVQTNSLSRLASYPLGSGALSPKVKQAGREANHLPLTSTEVKKTWS